MKHKGFPMWRLAAAMLAVVSVGDSVVIASAPSSAGGGPQWGELAIEGPDDPCGFFAGASVTLTIRASGLLEPINGVQALVRFDTNALMLDDIEVGDGAGSPWDGGALLSDIDGGDVTLGVVLLGDATDVDAVVARMTFTTLFDGDDLLAQVDIVASDGPLTSKLTVASDGSSVSPALTTPARVPHVGDDEPDGDIDLIDFSAFLDCVTGPAPDGPLGDCCRFDFDRDDDVDAADYGEFSLYFTGEISP